MIYNEVLIQDIFRQKLMPKMQLYLRELREEINPTNSNDLPPLTFYHSTGIEFVNIIKEKLVNKQPFYPFIFIDSQGVEYGNVDYEGMIDVKVKSIVIAVNTLSEFLSQDRDLNNIKPILLPMETKLRELMKNCIDLKFDNLVQADRKIWYCYGKEGLYGVESVFGDIIDAIELKNLNFKIKNNC